MLRASLYLLGFVAIASPLSAQENEPRSFNALMEDGLRLREEGQDAEALAAFQACLELRPGSGQAIGQVAFAEMALGYFVLAEAHLIAALGRDSDAWVRRHRAALEEAQATLHAQIATLEIPTLGGEVTFMESGQEVTRWTPVTLRLSPGRHAIRVTVPGFEPAHDSFTLVAGQTLTHRPARRPSVVIPQSSGASGPSEIRGPLADEVDPELDHELDHDRYLVRSIRLDVGAGILAACAIGTGIATDATANVASFPDGWPQRTTGNKALMFMSIGSAVVAVALFIGARVARGKNRRENLAPSF